VLLALSAPSHQEFSQGGDLPQPSRRSKRAFCDDITRYEDDDIPANDPSDFDDSVNLYAAVASPSSYMPVDDSSISEWSESTESSTDGFPLSPNSFSGSSSSSTTRLETVRLSTQERQLWNLKSDIEADGEELDMNQVRHLFAAFEWALSEAEHRASADHREAKYTSPSFPDDFQDRLDIDPYVNLLPRIPALFPGQSKLPPAKRLKFSSESLPRQKSSAFTPETSTSAPHWPSKPGATHWSTYFHFTGG